MIFQCSPSISPFICRVDQLLILEEFYLHLILQLLFNFKMFEKCDWNAIWKIPWVYRRRVDLKTLHLDWPTFSTSFNTICLHTQKLDFFQQETLIEPDFIDHSCGWHHSQKLTNTIETDHCTTTKEFVRLASKKPQIIAFFLLKVIKWLTISL